MQSLLLGDLTGFAALAFVGASAAIMAFRARFVKVLGGVEPLRDIHIAVSILATVFLSVHIIQFYSFPLTLAMELGYGAFALGLVLWATGVGFLERNKDSFFLHGSLAVAVVALVVVHAAASGATLPPVVSVTALIASGTVALASASYNIRKMRTKSMVR
ncbi:MAG: hypothetical protein JRN06_05220 [Nitrososphaerota archaeon]|nr:hypothetical protein [Nitrososphaerota archaeon]MDG7024017.1 hypothetical protein [Nitrososphaerota archaeon]